MMLAGLVYIVVYVHILVTWHITVEPFLESTSQVVN